MIIFYENFAVLQKRSNHLIYIIDIFLGGIHPCLCSVRKLVLLVKDCAGMLRDRVLAILRNVERLPAIPV